MNDEDCEDDDDEDDEIGGKKRDGLESDDPVERKCCPKVAFIIISISDVSF